MLSADVTGIVAGFVTTEIGLTVLRMIGEYTIAPSGANVISDVCVVSVGIGIVSSDAATLGGTAVPDPGVEFDYLWLFWQQHIMQQQVASQDSQGDPSMALRQGYDIRSMRKLKPRESLCQIFQYQDINGIPSYDLAWGKTRVLVGIGAS